VLRSIFRASTRLRDLHGPHFQKLDMQMAEFDLIAALGNTDGMRMKDLAQAMITTPPNVTRICAVLEERGLVKRRRSPHSDREVVASLTAEGQRLFEATFPPTVNYGAAILDTALSRSELTALAELLEKLLKNVRAPDGA
jgi:DNA-binding MarR family transcriptional regulator